VRAWPDQLHIRDMKSYNEVYKIGTKYNKDPNYYDNAFFNGSLINISATKEAKQRKDMFQPYFSKAAILRVEPLLKQHTTKLIALLCKAGKAHRVVDLTMAFKCLTADIIMDYCYQKPFGAMDAPDFQFPLIKALDDSASTGQWDKYFVKIVNLLSNVVLSIPPVIGTAIIPAMKSILWMRDVSVDKSQRYCTRH
jgi:hypothetical protein